MRKWFDGKLKRDQIDNDLFRETFKKLSAGVSEGYQTDYDESDVKLLLELKSNIAVFSAFKAHSNSLELFDALVGEDGKKRSWPEFQKIAAGLDARYNKHWLEVEYNMAIRQGRSAVQWQEFERSKDLYPNLEYMRSRAANPSDLHKKYYGIIKPVSDPIWDTLMPPSRWNCQCWVKQTKADATEAYIDAPEPVRGIVGNAGKSGRIFSADHPYIANLVKTEKDVVKMELGRLKELNTELIRMKAGKNEVMIHVNADQADLDDNLVFAKTIAKTVKTDVTINPHSYTPGVKNPELTIGKVVGDRYTVKGTNLRTSIVSAFDAKVGKNGQLRDQKSAWIGIDFQGKLNPENVAGAMAQLVGKMKRYPKVSYVILTNGDKVIRVSNKDIDFEKVLKNAKGQLLA